jgi:hypothetical protein
VLEVAGEDLDVVDAAGVAVVDGLAVVELTVELDALVEPVTSGAVWVAVGMAGNSVSTAARTVAHGSWGNIRAQAYPLAPLPSRPGSW